MSAAHVGERQDATDLFLTQEWFDNLLAHGFERKVAPVVVRWNSTAGSAGFYLMRDDERGALCSLSNYYSGLFGPVGAGAQQAVTDWDDVARRLREAPGSAVLQMQSLDADSDWLPRLNVSLRRAGFWTAHYFCFGNWYQSVEPGGFDVYWAGRPSALRNTVARARRRLDKQGNWQLQILTGGGALEAAIDAFVSVYNRSWKTPEPNPAFIPSLIRLAAQQGWLRLGLVHVAGEPVAAQLWLVAGGKANIFKLAYAQGAEKLSVGSVLTAALMQQVIDVDQVREVDFLSGDDPYKADWMGQRRERIGLVAFDKRHWRGWMGAMRHQLGQWRRAWRQAR